MATNDKKDAAPKRRRTPEERLADAQAAARATERKLKVEIALRDLATAVKSGDQEQAHGKWQSLGELMGWHSD